MKNRTNENMALLNGSLTKCGKLELAAEIQRVERHAHEIYQSWANRLASAQLPHDPEKCAFCHQPRRVFKCPRHDMPDVEPLPGRYVLVINFDPGSKKAA